MGRSGMRGTASCFSMGEQQAAQENGNPGAPQSYVCSTLRRAPGLSGLRQGRGRHAARREASPCLPRGADLTLDELLSQFTDTHSAFPALPSPPARAPTEMPTHSPSPSLSAAAVPIPKHHPLLQLTGPSPSLANSPTTRHHPLSQATGPCPWLADTAATPSASHGGASPPEWGASQTDCGLEAFTRQRQEPTLAPSPLGTSQDPPGAMTTFGPSCLSQASVSAPPAPQVHGLLPTAGLGVSQGSCALHFAAQERHGLNQSSVSPAPQVHGMQLTAGLGVSEGSNFAHERPHSNQPSVSPAPQVHGPLLTAGLGPSNDSCAPQLACASRELGTLGGSEECLAHSQYSPATSRETAHHTPRWASLPATTACREMMTSSDRARQEGTDGGDFWKVVRTRSDQVLLHARLEFLKQGRLHEATRTSAVRAAELEREATGTSSVGAAEVKGEAVGLGSRESKHAHGVEPGGQSTAAPTTLSQPQQGTEVDVPMHGMPAPQLGVLRPRCEPLIMAHHASGIKKRRWGGAP